MMKLWEVSLSFELSNGLSTIVYPTLGRAKKDAIDHLKSERATDVDNNKKYDADYERDLSAKIEMVEVRPVSAELFCQVVNSGGGSYVSSRAPVMTLTLPAKSDKVVTTIDEGKQ
jgi:hypothetical protein